MKLHKLRTDAGIAQNFMTVFDLRCLSKLL